MNGAALIQTLKLVAGATTDLALSRQLGVTQPANEYWRNAGRLSVRPSQRTDE